MKTTKFHFPLDQIVACIETIRARDCRSFVDVAVRLPELWCSLRLQGATRRQVAQACGWPIRLSCEQIKVFDASQIGLILLNLGLDDPVALWTRWPRLCHFLHVEGKLSDALGFLVASTGEPESEAARSIDQGELESFGVLEAALRLDVASIGLALEQCGPNVVLQALPVMPANGWQTLGGAVLSIPDLIVARVLEYGGVAFEVPRLSSAHGVVRHLPQGGFHLLEHHAAIEFGDPRGSRLGGASPERARLARIDDGLLDSPAGIVAFLHHVVESLTDLGVPVDLRSRAISVSRFVAPTNQAARP